MRKEYQKPVVRSEVLSVGVFGAYGCDDDDGDHWWEFNNIFVGIWNPLFGLCCGG